MKSSPITGHPLRDLIFYKILWYLLAPWVILSFHITADKIRLPKGPVLILSNHTTGYDQFFVSYAIKKQAYFVITENAMRNPALRKLLTFLIAPIVHVKGKLGIRTATTMLKMLKNGQRVILFPEGNRNFDGTTMTLGPSVAKLAQRSGATLVNLRIEGGYLLNPRWGRKRKKGRIHVSLAGMYSPEELALKKPAEILGLIQRDLNEDAYERQKTVPQAFTNDCPAEGMESALYLCPSCKAISTLHTKGRILSCSCGFSATYDDYGILHANENEYNLRDLCRWQKEKLAEKYHEALNHGNTVESADILFSDDLTVSEIDAASHEVTKEHHLQVSVGTNSIFVSTIPPVQETVLHTKTDSIIKTIPLSEVESVSIYARNIMTVFFKQDDRQWECRGDFSFNALKYRDLLEIIK